MGVSVVMPYRKYGREWSMFAAPEMRTRHVFNPSCVSFQRPCAARPRTLPNILTDIHIATRQCASLTTRRDAPRTGGVVGFGPHLAQSLSSFPQGQRLLVKMLATSIAWKMPVKAVDGVSAARGAAFWVGEFSGDMERVVVGKSVDLGG